MIGFLAAYTIENAQDNLCVPLDFAAYWALVYELQDQYNAGDTSLEECMDILQREAEKRMNG